MKRLKIRFVDGELLCVEKEVIVKISEIKYIECNEAMAWDQFGQSHLVIRKVT